LRLTADIIQLARQYADCRHRPAQILHLGADGQGPVWVINAIPNKRPKAIRKRHEITMNKIEDRRSPAAHVNVRVLLPIPDRFDVQKLPFDAVEALTISAQDFLSSVM
jgi:hypothetical protein